MRIALAINRQASDSELSEAFGKSRYLLILDDLEGSEIILRNPFADSLDGAGIQTAQLLIEKNCDVLITRKIGKHALLFLRSAEIKVYISPALNVQESVRLLLEEKLEEAEISNIIFRERRRKWTKHRGGRGRKY